jgi:hypothetical protein
MILGVKLSRKHKHKNITMLIYKPFHLSSNEIKHVECKQICHTSVTIVGFYSVAKKQKSKIVTYPLTKYV